jgi:hypothetical protein
VSVRSATASSGRPQRRKGQATVGMRLEIVRVATQALSYIIAPLEPLWLRRQWRDWNYSGLRFSDEIARRMRTASSGAR